MDSTMSRMNEWKYIHGRLYDAQKKARKRMTKEEKIAVDRYHNLVEPGMAMRVNESLRSRGALRIRNESSDVMQSVVSGLDSVFSRIAPRFHSVVTLPEICLYRGISGPTSRRLSKQWHRKGTRHTFRGLLSTSIVPLSALFYMNTDGFILCMHIPTNKEVPFLYARRETEVTLPRNTTWKLVRKEMVSNTERAFAADATHWHIFDRETDYLKTGIVPRKVPVLHVEIDFKL